MNDLNRKKPSRFYRLISFITLFSLALTTLPQSSEAASSTIARGYLLNLSCASDPKLNGDFRVGSNGEVLLPYNVSLQVAGMKTPSVRALLEKTYAPYFHGKPNIQVSIKQRRYWVKILGLVNKPGDHLVKPQTTLGEALTLAAVRTEDLPTGFVRITNGTRSHWISFEDYLSGGLDSELPKWSGGEQILFQLERPEAEALNDENSGEEPLGPSARKVQVIGEVKNPGGVSFHNKGDGYYYLIQRGGPTQASDLDNVELLRNDRQTGEKTLIKRGSLQEIKDVRESDILLINPNRPTPFERTLQNSALLATILSSVVLTIFVAQK